MTPITLTIVSLAGAILLGFLGGWLLGRHVGPRKPMWFAISTILLVLGAGLVYVNSSLILDGFARKSWPHVDGLAVTVEVQDTSPHVVYEYHVEDVRYEGTSDLQTPHFGFRTNQRDTAQKVAAQVREADALRVFYDPDQPATSYLIPGPRYHDFLRYSVGALILVVAGLILARQLRRDGSAGQG